MAIEAIGDIANVSLTESEVVANPHASQSLSRRAARYPQRPAYIEATAPEQTDTAQALARRNHGMNTQVR
jgi:hypothetical protein